MSTIPKSIPGHPQPRIATNHDDWTRSDLYHNAKLLKKSEALESALALSASGGLRDIAVSPAQGKFLHLHARAVGAKRILEIGTLGGYSTIWLGQALPEDGELITLEINEKNAEIARKNIANAGLDQKVKVVIGPAIELLPSIVPDGSFDFIFIDADKISAKSYFIHAKRLVRSGGVIIVDNVVRNGLVSQPTYEDENVEGIRLLLDYIENEDGGATEATTIATVGEKGYDGFLYALKQ